MVKEFRKDNEDNYIFKFFEDEQDRTKAEGFMKALNGCNKRLDDER